jgi:hypothetical protein
VRFVRNCKRKSHTEAAKACTRFGLKRENAMSNRLSPSAIATLSLLLGTTLANAQQFGTVEEAGAMLERAVTALKSDETKALREFSDPNNKHDRDLYVSCFRISDGKFTAFPGPGMIGVDVRTFKFGDDPIGQRAFDAREYRKKPWPRWTTISRSRASQL